MFNTYKELRESAINKVYANFSKPELHVSRRGEKITLNDVAYVFGPTDYFGVYVAMPFIVQHPNLKKRLQDMELMEGSPPVTMAEYFYFEILQGISKKEEPIKQSLLIYAEWLSSRRGSIEKDERLFKHLKQLEDFKVGKYPLSLEQKIRLAH